MIFSIDPPILFSISYLPWYLLVQSNPCQIYQTSELFGGKDSDDLGLSDRQHTQLLCGNHSYHKVLSSRCINITTFLPHSKMNSLDIFISTWVIFEK
jgi:hypothetical protein